jgi:hypothetical protein
MIPVLVGDAQLPGFLRDRQAIKVASADDWDRVAGIVAGSFKPGQAQAAAGAAQASQAAERKQRLEEIAQDATKLEPTREELQRQVDLLRARTWTQAEPTATTPSGHELADGLSGSARRRARQAKAAAGCREPAGRRAAGAGRTNLATLLSRWGRSRGAASRARDLPRPKAGVWHAVTRFPARPRESHRRGSARAGGARRRKNFQPADRIFPPFADSSPMSRRRSE